MKTLGHRVLKEFNLVHNTKIWSYGVEMSELGTICNTNNNI